jgi:alpha-galactosidase
MLEVGNGGMSGSEYRCHVSIWALLKAPLIIGTDLRNASSQTLALLRNPELVAISQVWTEGVHIGCEQKV